MLPNGIEYLIAQQALARLGGLAVQIGYRLKPGEIAYILGNAEPTATLVHAEYLPAMREARAQAAQGRRADRRRRRRAPAIAATPRTGTARSPPRRPRCRRACSGGDGGGVIVYTSGTTGKPKGATRCVAQDRLRVGRRHDPTRSACAPTIATSSCARSITAAAPAFVAIMQSLGATIVLQNHFDPEQCLEIIQKERITCTLMVPTMMIRMCALPRGDDREVRHVARCAG